MCGERMAIATYLAALSDLIWPRVCLVCRVKLPFSHLRQLCEVCWVSLPRMEDPTCFRCALPLSNDTNTAWPLCGPCLERQVPYLWVIAAALYEDPLKACLLRWKYQHEHAMAGPLAQLLIEEVLKRTSSAGWDLVVPVPLHPTRARERGFNQSQILASAVSRAIQLPTETQALIRVRPTTSQSELKMSERVENVRGAFRVRHPQRISGQRVLLVDDIFTTGATASACALALRGAGAQEVALLVLARGVP